MNSNPQEKNQIQNDIKSDGLTATLKPDMESPLLGSGIIAILLSCAFALLTFKIFGFEAFSALATTLVIFHVVATIFAFVFVKWAKPVMATFFMLSPPFIGFISMVIVLLNIFPSAHN